MSAPENTEILRRLRATLEWSARRDYRGHDKHDALNSPFVSACTFGSPFLRFAATQAVMRFPVNLRPLLGVPAARNPKGIGLFAHALLDLADLARAAPGLFADERPETFADRAAPLLAWLVHHSSPNAPAGDALRAKFDNDGDAKPISLGGPALAGCGWGYHYPWQDAGFFQPRHFPNRVVTSWIGFAFLRAHEIAGEDRYLAVCRDVAVFLAKNPRALFDDDRHLCLSYVPIENIRMAVMDVSALASAFLARFARQLPAGDPAIAGARATARRLMAFVVDKQTDYGAWFYTWPAKDSHIKHDNYHTGIVLDCLADAIEFLDEPQWESAYRRGLDYYRKTLFAADGAPRWMNDRTFPHDIHGAATGILSFTRAALHARATGVDAVAAKCDLEMADRILGWTLAHLSDPAGFFYYRKGRFFTNRFCQMRWCNAWMSRAMAQRMRVG